MRVERVEVRLIELALARPFRAAHDVVGAAPVRPLAVVRITIDGGVGYGECAALAHPTYSPEYAAGACDLIASVFGPSLVGSSGTGGDLAASLDRFVGNPMAKAAMEMALLDAEAKAAGLGLLGEEPAVRSVPVGAVVGLADDPANIEGRVSELVALGYRRITLKITPDRALATVSAALSTAPAVTMYVDANGSFDPDDPEHTTLLLKLEAMGIELIEQPYPPASIAAHARLENDLTHQLGLDESITSIAEVEAMLGSGARSAICVKPSRLGGLAPAIALIDRCRLEGLDHWVGGMLESTIGRAAALALAAQYPSAIAADLSPPSAYLAQDTATLLDGGALALSADGTVAVPPGPGIGVRVTPALFAEEG